jgi:hypothetical protein
MRRRNRWRTALIFGLTGWLFADLFIALTMGFVANIVGYTPTPTPTTPAVSISTHDLSLTPIHVTLTVDPQGIIDGNSNAIAAVEQQIQGDSDLSCKLAGLVLTFGGAPSANDVNFALQLADAMDNSVFPDLGAKKFVFDTAVYREFFNLGTSSDTVQADVYVFKNISSC